jgi:CRISPR-associated protein Cmr1
VQANGRADPLALLDRVGREILRYRSKGRKDPSDGRHKVLGSVPSEARFDDDHQLMRDVEARKTPAPTGHPRRIVFGLPHNYIEGTVTPADGDRRASPLLIHAHQVGEKPVVVLSFLPAAFLPEGMQLNVGRKVRNGQVVHPGIDVRLREHEFWKPIEDLLDRFLDTAKRKESFGASQEVRP